MYHILIPVDFSQSSLNAIAYAQQLLLDKPVYFHLLHVNEAQPLKYGSKVALLRISENQKQKNEFISQINQLFASHNAHFEYQESDNSFIASLRSYCSNHDIHMVFVGKHNENKGNHIGSHTFQVITQIQITTFIIPEETHFNGLNNIVFPTNYQHPFHASILEKFTWLLHFKNVNLCVTRIFNEYLGPFRFQQENHQYLLHSLREKNCSFHKVANTQLKKEMEHFISHVKANLLVFMGKNLALMEKLVFDKSINNHQLLSSKPIMIVH